MNPIECPVCDWTLDLLADPDSDYEQGLLGVMGVLPTTLSMRDAEKAEAEVFEHLSGHTTLEWVKAMAMADAYIAKLEEEKQTLAEGFRSVQAERDSLRESQRTMQTRQAAAQGFPPPPLPGLSEPLDWEAMSPRARQEQLARDRKAGITRTVSDTLIPFIPLDKRPEGVVGRRR